MKKDRPAEVATEIAATETEPVEAQTPEVEETLDGFKPYMAVTRSTTTVRRKPGGIHIGFITGGTTVKAISRTGGQVLLSNGVYVSEAMLEKLLESET